MNDRVSLKGFKPNCAPVQPADGFFRFPEPPDQTAGGWQ
jgi:hypothetical protein